MWLISSHEKPLIAYLTNSTKEVPEVVKKARGEDKQALAFFKQEISFFLPQTLSRRLDVNYGPSLNPNLDPIERTRAIPYITNLNPNEKNRFGNDVIAINYSIQMALLQGLSRELLIEYLSQLQGQAKNELLKNKNIIDIDDTPTAKGFALLTDQKTVPSLSKIDIKSTQPLCASDSETKIG